VNSKETDRGFAPLEPPGSYFVVDSASDRWLVSAVMARHLEQLLDRVPAPDWVSFVDLFGSRIRVRAVVIQSVAQSTEEQRAACRALSRRLDRERNEED